MNAYRTAELLSQPKLSFVDQLMLSGSIPRKWLGSFLFFFVYLGMVAKSYRVSILKFVLGAVLLALNTEIVHHNQWFIKGLDVPDQWFYSGLSGIFLAVLEYILAYGIYLSYSRSQREHLAKLRESLTPKA